MLECHTVSKPGEKLIYMYVCVCVYICICIFLNYLYLHINTNNCILYVYIYGELIQTYPWFGVYKNKHNQDLTPFLARYSNPEAPNLLGSFQECHWHSVFTQSVGTGRQFGNYLVLMF